MRFLCGVLVFALAGPPVGGMVAWLRMGAPTLRSPLPFIAGSWAEGGALALGVGVLTAIAAWFGRTSWLVPAITAFMVCAFFVLATAPDWPAMLRVGTVFMPPAVAASLVCWLLTRRLFRR